MSSFVICLSLILLGVLTCLIVFAWSTRLTEYDRAKRVTADPTVRSSYLCVYRGQWQEDGTLIDDGRSVWLYRGSLIIGNASLSFQQKGQQIFELAVTDIAHITYTPTQLSFETKDGQIYRVASLFSPRTMDKAAYMAKYDIARHDRISLSTFIEEMEQFNIMCQDTGWDSRDVKYIWSGNASPFDNVLTAGVLVISVVVIIYFQFVAQ